MSWQITYFLPLVWISRSPMLSVILSPLWNHLTVGFGCPSTAHSRLKHSPSLTRLSPICLWKIGGQVSSGDLSDSWRVGLARAFRRPLFSAAPIKKENKASNKDAKREHVVFLLPVHVHHLAIILMRLEVLMTCRCIHFYPWNLSTTAVENFTSTSIKFWTTNRKISARVVLVLITRRLMTKMKNIPNWGMPEYLIVFVNKPFSS